MLHYTFKSMVLLYAYGKSMKAAVDDLKISESSLNNRVQSAKSNEGLLETTVVGKVNAIISLMESTGRMKDFYGIYYLATTFDFEGRKLQEAI